MRIFFIFLLCSLFLSPTYSQLKSSDKKAIKNHLLKKINELREQSGVAPLIIDKRLAKAAEIQSFYMSKTNELTHDQSKPKFNTPKKRIEHFSPLQFDIIGENVLLSKKVKLPINKNTIIRISESMFNAWKDSPGHYANMIEAEFNVADFGFALNKNNQIYATNVFGRIGIKIEGQLSENQFGLKEDLEGNCFDKHISHDNILVNVGNAVVIEGDEIIFYYHDINYLKSIFSGPNDGIAIDLIDPTQFSCKETNQLDLSPIHDGILLKPVFRNELFQNNTAQSGYRIITKLGTIPKALLGKQLTLGVLLIKNGVVCKYVIPSYIPHGSYPLKELPVNLEDPIDAKITSNKSIESVTLPFHFQTNQTVPVSFPKIKRDQRKIHSIEIKSYSSIEGTEAKNKILHKKRAEVIKKHLTKELNTTSNKFKITTKENWDEFYFQLKYYFADTLLNHPKDELRKLASQKSIEAIPWDTILYQQRKSIAIINYKGGNVNKDSSELIASNLRFAILNKDIPLAKKALFKMYHGNNIKPDVLFEESIFDAFLTNMDLVENASAILIKFHQSNLTSSTKFVNRWLIKSEQLSPEAKFNLLNLYTIINNHFLDIWDLPSKRLANVIDPKYVNQLSREFSSNELMLNLHLTFIKYYGQVNNGIEITKSFNYISKYFSSRVLKIEDAILLSKFYNHWSMYQLTNTYLLEKFEENKLNEDATFLLMQSLYHFNEEEDIGYYDEVYQKALKLNKSRWCALINSEIQLLRDRKLKGIYCAKCL